MSTATVSKLDSRISAYLNSHGPATIEDVAEATGVGSYMIREQFYVTCRGCVDRLEPDGAFPSLRWQLRIVAEPQVVPD